MKSAVFSLDACRAMIAMLDVSFYCVFCVAVIPHPHLLTSHRKVLFLDACTTGGQDWYSQLPGVSNTSGDNWGVEGICEGGGGWSASLRSPSSLMTENVLQI